MKIFLTMLALSTTIMLTACGGDSSSSSSKQEPFFVTTKPTCNVLSDVVYVNVTRGCKITSPKLNDGRVFALECKRNYAESLKAGEDVFNLEVLTADNADIDSVIKDFENASVGKTSVFNYVCDDS